MNTHNLTRKPLQHIVKEQMLTMLFLTLYFAALFMTVTYLKFGVLQKEGIPYTGFGLGLIRAVVCAKFMMIIKHLYPVKIEENKPLIWHILKRSLVYLIIIVLLVVIEEALVAKIHGTSIHNAIIGIAPGTLNQFCALSILYWLTLIPLVTYSALSQAIGIRKFYYLIFVNGKYTKG